jgi:hypothetical protein
MIGAITLFISAAVLIIESRVTYSVIADEVNFVIESTSSKAPDALKKEVKRNWKSWLGL